MFKKYFILITTIFISCGNNPEVRLRFGCDAPCEEKEWLTFPYDKTIMYSDTSGDIKKALDNKNLENYIAEHNGEHMTNEFISKINQALSCRMWTCDKTPIQKDLFNPETIIIFLKKEKPVSYVAVCSKSNIIQCFPNSDNTEIAILKTLLHSLKLNDE